MILGLGTISIICQRKQNDRVSYQSRVWVLTANQDLLTITPLWLSLQYLKLGVQQIFKIQNRTK